MMQRTFQFFRPFRNLFADYTSTELPKLNVNLTCPFSVSRTLNSLVLKPKIFEGIQTPTRNELSITQDVVSKVNEQIKKGEEGRLFAVIHVCGKQFKVTPEDIIIVEGYWPPQNGDEIKMEKILLVGGMDFTLVGRPILPQGLVTVTATVIEKDLSHTKTIFFKRRRKQYKRINFFRSQLTMLRINDVAITGKINEHNSYSQYERI